MEETTINNGPHKFSRVIESVLKYETGKKTTSEK